MPRVALNWYTVCLFVDFLSLSLTKLSMENKCGIYVLQKINKNSQVVPKIFFVSVFLVLLPLVCKCVCVCVLVFFSFF